jgi:5-methylcytosine-specific restriction endonuclease McrA
VKKLALSEPDDAAWKRWRTSCRKKTQEHIADIAAGKPISISELYKSQKDAYWDVLYAGRCAYCERSVGNQHGDIDHYRPKGAVRDEQRNVVTRTIKGHERPHPGYYWLAYEWTNLILACQSCNQPMPGHWGKHDRFPVDGDRAWKPGDEANEKPLLLHPAFDDPAEHIELDPLTGILRDTTERGRATIAIFGLNQRDLPLRRKQMFDDICARFNQAVAEWRTTGNQGLVERLSELKSAEGREFPSVVALACRTAAREVLPAMNALAQ